MNPLAQMFLEREMERLRHQELRRLADELRQKQAELRPMIAARDQFRRDRMRMDGPQGFVMVGGLGKKSLDA